MKTGDPIPQFELPDQDWNMMRAQDLIGKPCVIYFYPKDDTPGCIKQACKFRDQFEQFETLGAEIVGVSSDLPEKHRAFQAKFDIPFRLLSDAKGELREKFEVPNSVFGLIPGRVTFIFDSNGILTHRFNSQTNAEKHIDIAIKELRKLT